MLGSVVYDELLHPPCADTPAAAPAPSANPMRRPRFADLMEQADDTAAAKRMRRSEATCAKRKRTLGRIHALYAAHEDE